MARAPHARSTGRRGRPRPGRGSAGRRGRVAVALGIVAWTWRTGAVGGSDSACYALMARVFAEGAWQPMSPLALDAPWPDRHGSPRRPGSCRRRCGPGPPCQCARPVTRCCSRQWWRGRAGRRPPRAAGGRAPPGLVRVSAGPPAGLAGSRRRRRRAGRQQPDRAVPGRAADERHHDRRAVAGRRRGDDGGRPIVAGSAIGVALLVRPNLAVAAAAAVVGTAWASRCAAPTAVRRFVRASSPVDWRPCPQRRWPCC